MSSEQDLPVPAWKDMAVISTRGLVPLLLAAVLLVLTGCASSRGGSIPYGVQDFGQPDAPSLTTIEEDYRIAPLDKLSVDVFQVKEFSESFALSRCSSCEAVRSTARMLPISGKPMLPTRSTW